MTYADTTWDDILDRAVGVAEFASRDPQRRSSLLPEADRQALPDLASRLLLRAVDDTGDAFQSELPAPEMCARVVGSLKRAATLAVSGERSIVSQAYGRASARRGDPVDVDVEGPDPFSASEIREEASAILDSLSDRARAVLRVQRGEALRPTDVPERTWRRWTASAIAEATDRIEERRR